MDKRIVRLIHISLLLIIAGACITFFSARQTYLHIRQGESNCVLLPFPVELIHFEIVCNENSSQPVDFISFLKIDGDTCRVSMNKNYIHRNYRFIQMSYDLDEQGTVLLINHDPIGCKLVYAGYLLGILSFFGLLFFRTGWKAIACIGAFTASLWYAVSLYSLAMPVLRTSWLAAHVSLISISYLLLFVIAILGVVGLCFQKQRQRLFLWSRKLLYPAIFLLAAGIIVGSVWANISWGRYWGWDAKETWALITLLVYTLPLHRKYLLLFQEPSKFHLFCIIAFLSVLMTFFGVNYWLGGIHSYV